MSTRRIDRTSRADDLRRLLEVYGTAEEALAAGNYYVAARRADATPEIRAAALTLAGFHEAGHRLFRHLRPGTPLTVFAKAIACLFADGRQAALAGLDASAPLAGPAASLREVLADGRVQIHFLTAWRSWHDRITAACAGGDSHGLDLHIRTVSALQGADLRVDLDGADYLDAMARAAGEGGHAASIVFDDLEVLPEGFERSPVPTIKIVIDYHHSIARMAGQMDLFDHLVAYGAETQERLHGMFGRRAPMFMRLSDMSRVGTVAGEDAGIDMFLSGALLRDYSPRREALAHRCVEEIEEGRVVLADGLLPEDLYRRMIGGARLVPAMLEEGNAIPSPRFYEALNAGMTVVADDPAFFAWALPDHADLFVDVETAFRIARGPRTARPPLRPRPPSHLEAVDQLLHLALVVPLLGSGRNGAAGAAKAFPATVADPAPLPRLIVGSNYARQFLVASGSYPGILDRALRLAAADREPLAVLDAARFFAEMAQASSYFAEQGFHIQLADSLKDMLAAIAGPDSGDRPPAPVCRLATTEEAVLLARAALGLLQVGVVRHPGVLALGFEHLNQWRRFCGEGEALHSLVVALRARRGHCSYRPLQSDPGQVGMVLSDRLAREVLAGRISDLDDLAQIADETVWHLVDLAGAACDLAAGRIAVAAATARRILATCPGFAAAADMLVTVWQVAPEAAYGRGGGCGFFRQALEEVLARHPSRIEGYGPALVGAALADGDRQAAGDHHAAWLRWTARLVLPNDRRAQREASRDRLRQMMDDSGLR